MNTERRRRPSATVPVVNESMREMFAAREEARRLAEIVDQLRSCPRARLRAKGLPTTTILDIFFAEQCGKTGGR